MALPSHGIRSSTHYAALQVCLDDRIMKEDAEEQRQTLL